MLAHADSAGWVDIHPRAISEEVGLTVIEVNAAIKELESPDPESRSPEENGRRIVLLDEHRAWGWRIVNHGKYRSIRDEADRREQNRIAQEKFRNKNKPKKEEVSNSNQSKPRKPISAQAEAEAEAKNLLSEYSDEFEQFWKAYPKRTGKGAAWISWKKQRPALSEVLSSLSWQTKSNDWIKDNGQFVPMPATYLNQRRWQDDNNSQKSQKFDLNDFMKDK